MIDAQLLKRITAGRTDLVLDFVALGGTASAEVDGASLMQWCAYYGDVSAVRFLLSQGETLHCLGSDLGLNVAAFHGHWQLSQFLLESSAPVNGKSSSTGETPLHSALCSTDRVRYDQTVKVLLAAGADPNAATHFQCRDWCLYARQPNKGGNTSSSCGCVWNRCDHPALAGCRSQERSSRCKR